MFVCRCVCVYARAPLACTCDCLLIASLCVCVCVCVCQSLNIFFACLHLCLGEPEGELVCVCVCVCVFSLRVCTCDFLLIYTLADTRSLRAPLFLLFSFFICPPYPALFLSLQWLSSHRLSPLPSLCLFLSYTQNQFWLIHRAQNLKNIYLKTTIMSFHLYRYSIVCVFEEPHQRFHVVCYYFECAK